MTPVTEPSACVTGVNDAFQWRAAPSRPSGASARGRAPPRRWPGRAGSRNDRLLVQAVLAQQLGTARPTSSPTGRALKAAKVSLTRTKRRSRSTRAEAHRRGGEHGVQQAQRALGAVVQARVVDRQRAALGQRRGEGQVGLRVVAPGAGREQRHRPEHPPAGRQRHDHVRLGRQALDRARADRSSMRLVDGGADVGGQDRLTGLGDPARLRGALLLAPPARGSPAARPRAPDRRSRWRARARRRPRSTSRTPHQSATSGTASRATSRSVVS